jgi:hypothetical protein
MAQLFSAEWMEALGQLWNKDEKMLKNLENVHFDSVVGYGYKDESKPRGVLVVREGRVVHGGAYTSQDLNWDLRADITSWENWLKKGFGLARLGSAVTSGELKFVTGDYRQMIKNVRLSVPFLRHLDLMQQIKTEFKR